MTYKFLCNLSSRNFSHFFNHHYLTSTLSELSSMVWLLWTSLSWLYYTSSFCKSVSTDLNYPFNFIWLKHLYLFFNSEVKFPFFRKLSWSILDEVNQYVPNHLLLWHSCIMIHLLKCWVYCCMRIKSIYFSF